MQMRTQGVRATATVLVAGLLLTGCTGDPAPVATTTQASATAAPTPSPTPTPTLDTTVPPERPEAMATPSPEGAAAAASYFISLYPYVYATGDLAEWDQLSAGGCAFCDSTRAGATRVSQGKGRVEGGEITITDAVGTEIEAEHWYSAKVTATEAPSSEVDMNGIALSASEGGRYLFTVALTFVDGRWTVDAVDVESTTG